MPHMSIRATEKQKEAYVRVASQLRMTLSDLVLRSLDAVCERVIREGWESRRIHIMGARIVAVGEDVPQATDGLPMPVESYVIYAPTAFWSAVRSTLSV